ncbi:unnamed protein product, partial [Rotaria magnacalcarata]
LQWLRKHPHVQHEISEMQEEQRQHQHSVNHNYFIFLVCINQ